MLKRDELEHRLGGKRGSTHNKGSRVNVHLKEEFQTKGLLDWVP